ncbi:OspG family effector kinase [Pseudomonas synxantha]|uniref:Kinase OspG kinase domain-containing protein n=1 Tax=Pseudomonas synxantha TaxID=47883 RepID=A0AAU8TD08_9PSED|nr:hypothetical protein [Pseudomonas synxantha]AKA80580.1 hypothetical protein VO64_0034 [Pseudomonas synxantha]
MRQFEEIQSGKRKVVSTNDCDQESDAALSVSVNARAAIEKMRGQSEQVNAGERYSVDNKNATLNSTPTWAGASKRILCIDGNTRMNYMVISAAAEVDFNIVIGGGGEGVVYAGKDGESVYKKMRDISEEHVKAKKGIEFVWLEKKGLNALYGDDFSEVVIDVEKNLLFLKIKRINGMPMSKMRSNEVREKSHLLRQALEEMEEKGLVHNDMQLKNFIYSAADNRVFPIDFTYGVGKVEKDRFQETKARLFEDIFKKNNLNDGSFSDQPPVNVQDYTALSSLPNDILSYIECIRAFDHQISEECPYEITSFDLEACEESFENVFQNRFEPEVWTLLNNVRQKKSSPYHASDILRYQYEVISRRGGYYGRLPRRIILDSVGDEDTIRTTQNLNTQKLKEIFPFTPVGKFIFRLMEHHKLSFESVCMQAGNPFCTYVILIKPNTSSYMP